MTIWLLAVVLLASLAGIGYRQGAIRVGISLIGIVLGALLAVPLGRLIKPVLTAVGMKNPALLWLTGSVIAFLIILTVFKVIALALHQKADVYFKYKAGDLRLALWTRLSHRLGLCLGLVNGTVYLILISFLIYAPGYWLVQLATTDEVPTSAKILVRMAKDLQSTGMSRVVAAIDPLPDYYYDLADLAGLIYNNPLAEARLSRYPAFLSLGERPEFQDIAQDTVFTEMRLKHAPIKDVVTHPKFEAIIQNPELLDLIRDAIVPNLTDLRVFLATAKSGKYDPEAILGRWEFDVNGAINALRRAKPSISSTDMQKFKKWMQVAFAKTSLVAAPDHLVVLKNAPRTRLQAGVPLSNDLQTLRGKWEGAGSQYRLSLPSEGRTDEMKAEVSGDRLTVASEGMALVFVRED